MVLFGSQPQVEGLQDEDRVFLSGIAKSITGWFSFNRHKGHHLATGILRCSPNDRMSIFAPALQNPVNSVKECRPCPV